MTRASASVSSRWRAGARWRVARPRPCGGWTIRRRPSHTGRHRADRVADDAARPRPVRAGARGVRVRRARASGRLVIGSRAGAIVGVAPETGHIDWVTGVSGGVDSEARFDAARGQVYIGADDGSFYAVDPKTGAIRWTYRGQGRDRTARRDRPRPGLRHQRRRSHRRAGGRDREVALAIRTRHARRVHDSRLRRAAPARRSAAGGVRRRLFRVARRPRAARSCGRSRWRRRRTSSSTSTRRRRSRQGDVTYVSSYSGGLYALDARDGAVRWRLGIEGVGDVTADAGRLYFVAPRFGLHAAHPDGHVLWRQGLSEAGDLTHPMVIGSTWCSRAAGPGCSSSTAAPASCWRSSTPATASARRRPGIAANHRLYVLSNGGSLYALNLN